MTIDTPVQRRECNSCCISAAGYSGETRELEIKPNRVMRQEKVESCHEHECAREGCCAANPTSSKRGGGFKFDLEDFSEFSAEPKSFQVSGKKRLTKKWCPKCTQLFGCLKI